MKKQLITEKNNLIKKLQIIENDKYDNIEALETLEDINGALSCMYPDDFLRDRYKELSLVIKHCKNLNIEVTELEKAYHKMLSHIKNHTQDELYHEEILKDRICISEGIYANTMLVIGKDAEDSEIIFELHDKIIKELKSLEKLIDDNMKLKIDEYKKEVESYYDFRLELIQYEITQYDEYIYNSK